MDMTDHFAAICLPQESDHRHNYQERLQAFAQQDRECTDEGGRGAGGIR